MDSESPSLFTLFGCLSATFLAQSVVFGNHAFIEVVFPLGWRKTVHALRACLQSPLGSLTAVVPKRSLKRCEGVTCKYIFREKDSCASECSYPLVVCLTGHWVLKSAPEPFPGNQWLHPCLCFGLTLLVLRTPVVAVNRCWVILGHQICCIPQTIFIICTFRKVSWL